MCASGGLCYTEGMNPQQAYHKGYDPRYIKIWSRNGMHSGKWNVECIRTGKILTQEYSPYKACRWLGDLTRLHDKTTKLHPDSEALQLSEDESPQGEGQPELG